MKFLIFVLQLIAISTKWTQHTNDTSLHSRIDNISDWKDILQKTLSDTEKEIDQLTFTKRVAECALEAKEMPISVVMECLVIREGRVAIDLVRDNVETELHKVGQTDGWINEWMDGYRIDRWMGGGWTDSRLINE